ncbi:MAG: hypothetical protein NTX82_06105 [Candidatus Parcubacteria bacterium]|nr:hypothetical protein [Candidatus Parcubacteria bacterium]
MCGIGGEVVKITDKVHIARRARNSGIAINYRGNESAGISITDGIDLRTQKGYGEFKEAIPLVWVETKKGLATIYQTRYSTTGSGASLLERDKPKPINPLIEFEDMENLSPGLANCQPFYLESKALRIKLAVVQNGNLTNLRYIRNFLASKGITKFLTETDTELILQLIVYFLENPPRCHRSGTPKIVNAIKQTMKMIRGAYSCLVLSNEGIWAFRDPKGIRPLKVAETPDSFIFASEPVAWHGRDVDLLGNVTPGSIVEAKIGAKILKIHTGLKPQKRAFCVFEDIYLQAGYNEKVALIRKKFGYKLFELHSKPGIVIPIMNSGEMAALGYHAAQSLRFPGKSFYWPALYKNPHIGRTFLEPSKDDRVEKNKKKYFLLFRALADEIGLLAQTEKEIWLIFIDDSLVRANVSRTLIKIIRQSLKENYPELYHRFRIAWLLSSPPYTHPCYYGVDTYIMDELIAARFGRNLDKIRCSINASYIGYLPVKDTLEIAAQVHGLKPNDFCAACFGKPYPVLVDLNQDKMSLAKCA